MKTHHCIDCVHWTGEHWLEYAQCAVLHHRTARLGGCPQFKARPDPTRPDGARHELHGANTDEEKVKVGE